MMLCPVLQFAKREAIREIEKEVQRRWEQEKVFEIDAPQVRCLSACLSACLPVCLSVCLSVLKTFPPSMVVTDAQKPCVK